MPNNVADIYTWCSSNAILHEREAKAYHAKKLRWAAGEIAAHKYVTGLAIGLFECPKVFLYHPWMPELIKRPYI